jgi:hypothetical protein
LDSMVSSLPVMWSISVRMLLHMAVKGYLALSPAITEH